MSALNSVVLIADASESAAALWDTTTKVVADLISLLSDDSVLGVHLLGTRRCWEAAEWRADMPLPPEASGSGSFVAPVMGELRARRETPEAILLASAGPVFDLADWIGNSARWAIVHMDGEPSQEANEYVIEATPDALAAMLERLQVAAPLSHPPPVPLGFVKHRWKVDRAGYPLVYIPPLEAYIHLFPVAKPQYEQFLADARPKGCGDNWYLDLLKLNPRLSPAADSLVDYERLIITGVLPDDVRAYVHWQGPEYDLPTPNQWREAFQWMEAQDASVQPANLPLDAVAYRLWNGLLDELQPKTLLDLSLMRNGVVEWVSGPGGAWLGMGQPRESFFPNFHDALYDKPFEPTSLTRRSRLFGFRLMRRAE